MNDRRHAWRHDETKRFRGGMRIEYDTCTACGTRRRKTFAGDDGDGVSDVRIPDVRYLVSVLGWVKQRPDCEGRQKQLSFEMETSHQ